ncbi:MAG: ABC transporter ATP-binding protein/permease [Verrucomicrobiota bacterium]|nr:ABC transporter ATP-binding protein/permease [Verrucomicrobiota bacterium]
MTTPPASSTPPDGKPPGQPTPATRAAIASNMPPRTEEPFQPGVLFRLGKRYVGRAPLLALLYIVGTLLSSTIIPIAIATNYGKLTDFFAESSAKRRAEPSTATVASANPTNTPAPPDHAATTRAITRTYIFWVGLTLALLALSFGVKYLTAFFDQRITMALRRDLFNNVLQQSPHFFHENPAGRLMILLTQFAVTVALALRQLLVDPVLQLIGIIAVGHALYVRLLAMQAGHGNGILRFFGIIALFALLSPWLVSRMGKTLSRSSSALQEQILSMGTFLEGALNAPEEIQTLRAEPIFDKKHQKLLDAALRARMGQTVTIEKLNVLSQSPGELVLISLMGLAVFLAFDPTNKIDPGTIIALVVLTPQFMGAVQGISQFSINLSSGWPAIFAIDSILGSTSEVPSSPNAKDFVELEPSVTAKDLLFSYQPGVMRNVLQGASFEVPPGKITGFVARPGQGKTTFFRLLLRLYEPQGGDILLGGSSIREFTLKSLRSHVVLMSQFPTFFLDTVRENFLLAKPDATDEEIESLCRKTGLWTILEQNIGSNPLDQMFVPGPGKSLSGGQTKLLALTRCLLRAPSVLLLDESTTGMGPKEKFPLIQTMREACTGKTVLVVDHDIMWQTRFCDYFLVLSEGQIIQQGTRDELLASPGLFQELYNAASDHDSAPAPGTTLHA